MLIDGILHCCWVLYCVLGIDDDMASNGGALWPWLSHVHHGRCPSNPHGAVDVCNDFIAFLLHGAYYMRNENNMNYFYLHLCARWELARPLLYICYRHIAKSGITRNA